PCASRRASAGRAGAWRRTSSVRRRAADNGSRTGLARSGDRRPRRRGRQSAGRRCPAARPRILNDMQSSTDDDIRADFLAEANELLERVSAQLLELERKPDDPDLLNAIFRAFHTVKGGA